jgi:hypothetical protein
MYVLQIFRQWKIGSGNSSRGLLVLPILPSKKQGSTFVLTARYRLGNIRSAGSARRNTTGGNDRPWISDLNRRASGVCQRPTLKDKGALQHMLRIQIIGLAIMSALLMSAVVAGSAMAAELHQWLLVHLQSGVHLLLAEPIKVHSLGLLLLTDHTAPNGFGGIAEVVVHCHAFNDGTVGPHGLDLVLAITTELLKGSDKIPCNFVKNGACSTGTTPLALALNLPWLTHLYLEGSELRDKILGDGNGPPAWHVVCFNALGGEEKDSCVSEGGETSVAVNNVSEGVETVFDALGHNAECSVNGEAFRKNAGLVRGLSLTENLSSTLDIRVSFGP